MKAAMCRNKKSTVEGRWTNLMFSQRNNPYCDLLEIMLQIYMIATNWQSFSCVFCVFLK